MMTVLLGNRYLLGVEDQVLMPGRSADNAAASKIIVPSGHQPSNPDEACSTCDRG